MLGCGTGLHAQLPCQLFGLHVLSRWSCGGISTGQCIIRPSGGRLRLWQLALCLMGCLQQRIGIAAPGGSVMLRRVRCMRAPGLLAGLCEILPCSRCIPNMVAQRLQAAASSLQALLCYELHSAPWSSMMSLGASLWPTASSSSSSKGANGPLLARHNDSGSRQKLIVVAGLLVVLVVRAAVAVFAHILPVIYFVLAVCASPRTGKQRSKRVYSQPCWSLTSLHTCMPDRSPHCNQLWPADNIRHGSHAKSFYELRVWEGPLQTWHVTSLTADMLTCQHLMVFQRIMQSAAI